jgi:hypothetical protein
MLLHMVITDTTLKINYKAKVLAKTANMTPLLTHAFQVLNEWNKAKAGDPIPWRNIKERTSYLVPMDMSAATPGPSSTPIGMPESTSGTVTSPAVVPHTTSIDSAPLVNVVQGATGNRLTLASTTQEKKQRAGRVRKDSKRGKESRQEVQEQQPDRGDKSAQLAAKDGKRFSQTPTPGQLPLDQLWSRVDSRPTPLCTTCASRNLSCETTGTQLACVPCHTGQITCSYSLTWQA